MYIEIPPFKDMITDLIYVRKLEDGFWEAKGKSVKDFVYGKSSNRDEDISMLVISVFNSLERDKS